MQHLLLIMIGGGLGAGGRHLVGLAALRLFGPGLPIGTFFVNVTGSLLMGLFIGWLVRHETAGMHNLRYLVATGFLGGFTTFSAFSLEAFLLWQRGDGALALAYVVLSVALSIAGLASGIYLMRSF